MIDLDEVVNNMATGYWKAVTIAVINNDVDLLYDNAIALKALEEARISVKTKLK